MIAIIVLKERKIKTKQFSSSTANVSSMNGLKGDITQKSLAT